MFNKDNYMNSLSEKHRLYLEILYKQYPVKDTATERKKLIDNGRLNYPNGFEILYDGLVNLFIIYNEYIVDEVRYIN